MALDAYCVWVSRLSTRLDRSFRRSPMYACSSSRSMAIVSRVIGSGTVKGIKAALRVGMALMSGVGMGFEGNIVQVEFGGTVIGRGLKTAVPVVSPVDLDGF